MNITNFISDLEKKAAERITTEPDDYIGEDGLLYCGKCHTKCPYGLNAAELLVKNLEDYKKIIAGEIKV